MPFDRKPKSRVRVSDDPDVQSLELMRRYANGGSASSTVPDTYYPPEDIQRELQVLLNRPQEPRQADFFGRSAPQGIQRRGGEPVVNPFRFLQEAGRGALGMEPQMQRGSAAYRAGQALSSGPGAAATLPGKLAGSGADVLAGLGAAAGVIKPKGGNWLAGAFSVEKMLEPLKKPLFSGRLPFGADAQAIANALGEKPEQVLATADPAPLAINKWIDTKLTKYVKNEMATPEDPVRALAERGTLHFEPQNVLRPIRRRPWAYREHEKDSRTLRKNREAGGYPVEGLGKSNLARDWEALADINIQPDKAEVFLPNKSELERNPWLAKVSPDTLVYEFDADMSRLGFPHLIDELSNAMNPNSGLPASLRIQPKDLEKITVPQAVERVTKINEWRAAQKAEADALKARNPATFEYRAYETIPGTAEPNQKGLRWVELKLPEIKELLPGYSVKPMSKEGRFAVYGPDGRSTGAVGRSPEEAIANQQVGRQPLEDALKYEGDVMGHCVGGYCPDVIEGRSRIYSLRDKKGEPHVTIEVTPPANKSKLETDWFAQQTENIQDEITQEALKEHGARKSTTPAEDKFTWGQALSNAIVKRMGPVPDEISQIKGKGNKAPKDEYLPFVQDFVRSGNWSRVGDLQNTGLYRKSDFIDEFTSDQLDAVGKGEYLTMDEIRSLREGKNWKPIDTDPELDINPNALGMKAGGAINSKRSGAVKSSSNMTGMNLFDILRTV